MSNLNAERGPIHVHIGATIIVEGAAPSYDRLVAHVEKRLQLVPRFRQRIVRIPLGIENPVWGDDPQFDVRRHVRHISVPRPGRLDQLRDVVGRVMSEPLDMERPLWQLYLVEGLSGRHAYISKTHHALVDGVAAVDVGTILLDTSRRGTRIKAPEAPWDPDEPSPTIAAHPGSLRARAQSRLRAAGRAARTAVTTPAQTAARVLRTAEAFHRPRLRRAQGPAQPAQREDRPRPADRLGAGRSRSPEAGPRHRRGLNGQRSPAVGHRRGPAAPTFERRGDKVPDYLVALVPVSIRRPNEKGELGNRMSTIMVRLPLGELDPRKRLERLRDETRRLKESDNARAASLLIEATGWAPPTINRLLARGMARPLIFNLVVSNVPGPQQPLYLLGRRIKEIYPFVPLSPQNHALSIGVLSYDGRVYFGLAGDRDVVADLDDLASALGEALREQPVPRAKKRLARRLRRPRRG